MWYIFQSNTKSWQGSLFPDITGLPRTCCRNLVVNFVENSGKLCLWQAGKMQHMAGKNWILVSKWEMNPSNLCSLCNAGHLPKQEVNWMAQNLDKSLSLRGETLQREHVSHLAFLKAVLSKHLAFLVFKIQPLCVHQLQLKQVQVL